jgi:hypothetical protein
VSWQLFFERALAPNPAHRLQSVTDFQREFTRAVSGAAMN